MKKWIKKTYKKNKISKQIKTPKIFTYNLPWWMGIIIECHSIVKN